MNVKPKNFEGYQGFKEYLKQEAGLVYKPAFITLTYQCQCRCKHCGVGLFRKKNVKKLTTIEVKNLILDQLQECGLNMAYFFGGEPTLHKDLLELIRYSTKKGLYTRFDTNGLKLVDKDFVKAIKDAGITFVVVSLDSINPEVHDRFRGMKGSWKSAVQAIKNCAEMDIQVRISTVVTKQSLKSGDTKKVIQLGKDLGVSKIRLLTPLMVGRWYKKEEIRLSKEEIEELWSLLEPDFVFWEGLCDGTVPFVCASSARWVVAITAYGDVQPCCYSPIRFGNVREERLKNITDRMWKSSYFKRIDQMIERKNMIDCPMNDENFRSKILKLTEGKHEYPADYDESVFRDE